MGISRSAIDDRGNAVAFVGRVGAKGFMSREMEDGSPWTYQVPTVGKSLHPYSNFLSLKADYFAIAACLHQLLFGMESSLSIANGQSCREAASRRGWRTESTDHVFPTSSLRR